MGNSSFIGPPLSEGPLPAVFYFALSAHDSLHLDPFNQPALFLSKYPLRIFSMTLPGHEDKLPATEALVRWAEAIASGENVISHFIDTVANTVEKLIKENAILPDQLAVAGLSRGGFIAAHAAANIPQFKSILAFAPLTSLAFAKEFHNIPHNPLVQALDLNAITEKLIDKHLRFYIGNRDERVSTDLCFQWIRKLTEAAYAHHIRSPQVELIISPSIGRQGHGTSPEIFHDGARWLLSELGVTHV
jgi:predicted esterase